MIAVMGWNNRCSIGRVRHFSHLQDGNVSYSFYKDYYYNFLNVLGSMGSLLLEGIKINITLVQIGTKESVININVR